MEVFCSKFRETYFKLRSKDASRNLIYFDQGWLDFIQNLDDLSKLLLQKFT